MAEAVLRGLESMVAGREKRSTRLVALFDRGPDDDVLLLRAPFPGRRRIGRVSGGLANPFDAGAADARPLCGPVARTRRLGWVLIGLQLLAMLAFSTVQYSRYAVTSDFGAYSQAWWKIAHGQLDPFSTIFATTFWKNDAEFIMWPLSLLYHLDPHPILLLWVQDLVVAATEVAVLGWVVEIVQRGGRTIAVRRGVLLVLGAAVVMVLDPWVYETIAFDFHFETFAALFVVLAGWDLWAGRVRRLWLWVTLALLCGVLGSLYVVGVGLSGIAAGARTRRPGLWLTAVGVGSFLLFDALGAAGLGQRLIDSGYGYLVGPHGGHVDVVTIVAGIFTHSGAVAHLVALRWLTVVEFLMAVGLVGIVSPWGAGMACVVFVPSLLNANPDFFRLSQSFQTWPALPFVLVGSILVVLRLGASNGLGRRVAVGAAVTAAVSMVVMAVVVLPALPRLWIAVDSQAAAQLATSRAQIPAGAEVIASQGVIGRFATRQYAYPFPYQYRPVDSSSMTFPVRTTPVVFVLTPRQGAGEVPPAATMTAVRFIERRLGARVVDDRGGVYVLEWRPPPHVATVTVP
jgi:uncharacterized membrane protein